MVGTRRSGARDSTVHGSRPSRLRRFARIPNRGVAVLPLACTFSRPAHHGVPGADRRASAVPATSPRPPLAVRARGTTAPIANERGGSEHDKAEKEPAAAVSGEEHHCTLTDQIADENAQGGV